ncbi:MAG: GAF domain-containing protein, partial [Endomicrobia bacterium]|nr:GAF domain-containing protein [Endomicrobiia bacterium]
MQPSLEIDKVLPQVLDIVVEFFNPLRCSLMLVDPDGILRIKIGRNISNYSIRGLKLNPGEGIAGKVLQTGQPVVVE